MSKVGYVGFDRFSQPVPLGIRLDSLLYERDMNCSDLGKAIGVSCKTIYQVMDGQTPRLPTILKIADFFNVSLDWLILGKGERCRK